MYRRLIPTALLAALALAGCGSSSAPHPRSVAKATAFVCHHKEPAQAGECIRLELEARGITPAAPQLVPGTFGSPFAAGGSYTGNQCIDISRWQTTPDFPELYREGIRCVITQTNYGESASNPYLAYQVIHAHEAHMAVGVYVFELGECGSCQASTLTRLERPFARYVTLGAWVDAEVPGAYGEACTTASTLRHEGWAIVGVYGSPGTYSGGRCDGYVWPAEWGSGAPYPLNGYSSSAIVFRQWCGTCTLGGVGSIDRDEDRGLLALAHQNTPPKPVSKSQRKRELEGKYRKRSGEREFLTVHHCRQPPWHAAKPTRYEHACHVELARGHATNKSIAEYHARYHV